VGAAGEVPIGLGFDFSDGDLSNNQPGVIGIHMRCGRITRDTSGVMHTTVAEVVADDGGNGICFDSSHAVAEQLCPSGFVMVGLAGNELDTSQYNTISIRCQAVAADGSLAGQTTTVTFADTGTFASNPQVAPCLVGTAVVALGIRSGCAQDQVAARCAQLTCQ
jgi:hypothetical protein